jgi:hypothetical protein
MFERCPLNRFIKSDKWQPRTLLMEKDLDLRVKYN